VSCECVAGRSGKSRVAGRAHPGHRPGFSRRERLALALAAAVIGVWGWWGVDLDASRVREPHAGARAIAPGSLERQEDLPPSAASPGTEAAERGRQLFEASGCPSCHALDGSASIGPNLRGRWGNPQPLANGTSVLFDRAYFEESVLHPEAKIVRGYKPAMPSYEGLLKPEDLDALAEYIRSLK